jgi:catechol 2,3-dioxygenase-like lactoylglutathione lyase family enzyme
MAIRYCSAVLFVKDIPASRHFYEDLLGQQVEMDLGANVGYVGGFAIWEIGSASSMIFRRDPEGEDRLGRNNLELYFETEDLDGAAERLSAAGVSTVHAIYEQPWGQRALRIYDPDGHIVELGEPMPFVIQRFAAQGLTREAIQERTMMPLPMIDQVLAG